MAATTKQYVFNVYFNYKGDPKWAEQRRNKTLAYLTKLFENKAKFSCIAKDSRESCLLLKGYMNLNSPCSIDYAKRLLGKYCNCKPSYFGDMVSLFRLINVDRDLTVTGRLPKVGTNSTQKSKPLETDPNFVVKVLLESMDNTGKDKALAK